MCSKCVELTLAGFAHIVTRFPEVVELKRMIGDIDCLLKDVVTDSPPKDAFYKCLIAAVDLNDGSSSFAMEAINWTTALPLGEAR